jgi:hypothetical protein
MDLIEQRYTNEIYGKPRVQYLTVLRSFIDLFQSRFNIQSFLEVNNTERNVISFGYNTPDLMRKFFEITRDPMFTWQVSEMHVKSGYFKYINNGKIYEFGINIFNTGHIDFFTDRNVQTFQDPAGFGITLNKNGGTGSNSTIKFARRFPVLYTLPKRISTMNPPTGKVFIGWNSKADGFGIWYQPSQRIVIPRYEVATVTFYAQFATP